MYRWHWLPLAIRATSIGSSIGSSIDGWEEKNFLIVVVATTEDHQFGDSDLLKSCGDGIYIKARGHQQSGHTKF